MKKKKPSKEANDLVRRWRCCCHHAPGACALHVCRRVALAVASSDGAVRFAWRRRRTSRIRRLCGRRYGRRSKLRLALGSFPRCCVSHRILPAPEPVLGAFRPLHCSQRTGAATGRAGGPEGGTTTTTRGRRGPQRTQGGAHGERAEASRRVPASCQRPRAGRDQRSLRLDVAIRERTCIWRRACPVLRRQTTCSCFVLQRTSTRDQDRGETREGRDRDGGYSRGDRDRDRDKGDRDRRDRGDDRGDRRTRDRGDETSSMSTSRSSRDVRDVSAAKSRIDSVLSKSRDRR